MIEAVINHTRNNTNKSLKKLSLATRFSGLSGVQKKNVIYGGTFNPVHQGHVQMVNEVVQKLGAERVIVIPAGDPPHKSASEIASFNDRFAMLKAAFSNIKEVTLSQMERVKKPSNTYTLSTLQQFFKVDDLAKLSFKIPFVIGSDALKSLPTWGGAKELAENLLFIVFKRNAEQVPKVLHIENQPVRLDIEEISTPILPISSSTIRQKLTLGQQASTMHAELPPKVVQIIEEKQLYAP